ncbi:nitrite reductase [Paenibacillus sp. LC231]|uniref:nitrite reductase small subunit NirD n=1 Tax=unclassified Paenibacillus TaxID=185978 RepID=UPI0008DCC370|nr:MULTISPECIES: nitrite reductase small subunit NirD [unclassified Paenibacillus]MCT1397516.1 nitrite reductase small subunit NirD [Paenibacillus sp. p3-SID867]OIA98971.1 nitrite reductase [Paenibacillus sp. LC231]
METERFITVGNENDFLSQLGRVVHLGDREIAVFRTSDHQWFALDNQSPHPKGGPLSEAIVSGHYIYDPLYDWKIELSTGLVQAPDQGQVRVYPIRAVDGKVEVAV